VEKIKELSGKTDSGKMQQRQALRLDFQARGIWKKTACRKRKDPVV